MDSDKTSNTDLPPAAIEYIDAVIKKMRKHYQKTYDFLVSAIPEDKIFLHISNNSLDF